MDDLRFDRIYLENEQKELLSWMVGSENQLPAEQRGPFKLLEVYSTAYLYHTNITKQSPVRKGDLDTLAEARLLRVGHTRRGGCTYEITPRGRLYYTEMMRRSGEPVQKIEQEIKRYLDSESFRLRYEDAYKRWQEAEKDLWGAQTSGELTKIGHACREVMQAFAESAVQIVGVTSQPKDPSKTITRIRAVLDKRPSGAKREFLDALLVYWGTVSDLAQRQEHGAGKEGDELSWEDARLVVFQTMLVMYEIARFISQPSPT